MESEHGKEHGPPYNCPPNQAQKRRFSPREFLKARRPERFSDSVVDAVPILDRQILEFHLGTLTSRSQENDFENFARRLAERTICPNLAPHTGPTGGGDSKVDTETYPVADALTFSWYCGTGREAAEERWAFAFSAKKDWRTKVGSDIAKIAATSRGYRKAFFVTSQYVRDKVRADTEDRLRTKHSLDVRILDRSWILDRVFDGDNENLAIDVLRLSPLLRKVTRQGPLDLQRSKDLENVEARILDATQQERLGMQFVSDCIEAAELSRGLDRPRVETDGRFLRAERAAEAHGNSHQRVMASYQRAWTAMFWFEDFAAFSASYALVEKHAKGTENAYDLELLLNLWSVLQGSVRKGDLKETEACMRARTNALVAELDRLSADTTKPSASLQARLFRLHVRLQTACATNDRQQIDDVLRGMKDVVVRCGGLIGFPLEPLVEVLVELGHVLGDQEAYGELFETVTNVSSTRDGEVSGARLLYMRGAEQLGRDRPYDAIRTVGRALSRLYKYESRHDLTKALYLCGTAYERVGLLWAARGSFLTAASLATGEFHTYADITPMQAACYNRMKWLELKLGRLPHSLEWHEVDRCIKFALKEKGYDPNYLLLREVEFDAILGILLLKTDIWHLKRLVSLPDVLDGLNLALSGSALRFALGYEAKLPADLLRSDATTEEHYAFFARLRDQPAAQDIPGSPLLYETRTVNLESRILGCRVNMVSENSPPCVVLAESVLAALESLLATGLVRDVVAREPSLAIAVRKSDLASPPFTFELTEPDGKPSFLIQCPEFDPHGMSIETQGKLKDKVLEFLTAVLARAFFFRDVEDVFKKLFRDERAAERALNFTGSFVTLGNVLGHSPRTSVSDWVVAGTKDYPLRRAEAWDCADQKAAANAAKNTPTVAAKHGTGEPPEEIRDMARVKQTDIETVSLIREALWSRAKWFGVGFIWEKSNAGPPAMGLLFRDGEAGQAIFRNWRHELGECDREERIRIVIIRRLDASAPHSYRVVIGSNPDVTFAESEARYVISMSRCCTMEPTSDENLTSFLENHNKHGTFSFGCATMRDGSPALSAKNWIIKRQIHVREAWEIGRHDPDSVGIQADDNPIIPQGREDAPVLELLRWRREQEHCIGKPSGLGDSRSLVRGISEMEDARRKERAARKADKRRRKADTKRKRKLRRRSGGR